ncbi:hypothetical protein B1207_09820 [Legionella quinlivanii]|uniref:Ninein n=1 Tax=Legionella quinlivanii TaxID=45073 RepID=A0A364LHQ3_9GAMM|nr:hypothetical protein [Legionella quinlivanii]RAP35875.1 hypothetical protein B1207_09820 [Legionella quinlivanii]
MTPLFPRDGQPLTLSQGKTGDCYLIASIDCIYNASKEGRERLKSMFKELDNGDVELRVKRTKQSENLDPDKIGINYRHRIDPDTNEDVITIPHAYLAEIDASREGVRSNSLAVKILERISSYYYKNAWKYQQNVLTSISAHDLNNRHEGTSTAFVGHLLEVHSHDTEDIQKIISLKNRWPEAPVYISLAYGKKDIHGKYHGRHGLRLKEIIRDKNTPGGYKFVLVNPWNNTKEETINLADIRTRNTRFCYFSENNASDRLTWDIVNCTNERTGRAIFENYQLFQGLLSLQKQNVQLNGNIANNAVKLYELAPAIFDEPELLGKSPIREAFLACLESAPYAFDRNFHTLRTRFPDLFEKKDVISARPTLPSAPEKPENLFENALEHAISEKAKQAGFAHNARETVEEGLLNFYFQGQPYNLTQAGGLRFQFTRKEFDAQTIADSRVKEQLLPHGLSLAMAGANSELTSHGKKLLQSDYPLTRELYQQVISRQKNKNTAHLFNALYNLSLVNPRAAEQFLKFAKEDLSARVNLNDIIAQENDAPVRDWLARHLADSPQPTERLRRFEEFKEQLGKFSSKFSALNYQKYEERLAELDKFLADFKNNHSQELYTVHLDQLDALVDEKKNALRRSVQPYLLAEDALNRVAEQIRSLPVAFTNCHKVVAVILQKEQREEQVYRLVKQDIVAQAERLLGYSSGYPAILKAKGDYERNLNQQASGQIQNLRKQANDLVAPMVTRINDFNFHFNHCNDLVQVRLHQKALQEQLKGLTETTDASRKAASIEGSSGLPGLVKSAYQAKLNSIISTAQAAENRIINHSQQQLAKIASDINRFRIQFPQCNSEVKANERREELKQQLLAQLDVSGYEKALANSGISRAGFVDGYPPQIAQAIKRKRQDIDRQADALIVSIRKAAAPEILASINLQKHLGNLESKVKELEKEARTKPDYVDPAKKARTMYTRLTKNQERFLNGELSVPDFQAACKGAIDTALPDLANHRGYKVKKIALHVLSAVLSLGTAGIAFGINYAWTGRYSLFQPKTESESVTLKVDEAIKGIKPR